jgi:hypothetical protein
MTGPQSAAFTADPADPVPELDRATNRPDTRSAPPDDPSREAEIEPGQPTEPVGNDNIRAGRVGGVMGGPRQQQGQGEGG